MRHRLLSLLFHILHHYSGGVGGDGAGGGFGYLADTGMVVAALPSHGPQLWVILFQGLHICGRGVVVLYGGSRCCRRWGIFGGETGSIVFPEGGGRIEPGALCRSFRFPGHNTVLLDEVIYGVGPDEVARFLPLLHHQVFEDIGLVYAHDKLRDFLVVGDFDVVLIGVVLSPCEVLIVGAEMLVGGVSPVVNEGGLCRHPF